MIYLFKIYTFVPNIVFPLKFFSGPCNYVCCGNFCWFFFCLFLAAFWQNRASLLSCIFISVLVFGVKVLVAPAISFQSCFLQIPAQGLAGHHCSLSSKALIFFLVCPELNSCICFFMFLHMLIQFIIELTIQSHDFN